MSELVRALVEELGLELDEVLELAVRPRGGEIEVTVLDAYRNVRCKKFRYIAP